MDKDKKEESLFPSVVPMDLNNGLNEKRGKTYGTTSNESIQEDAPIYRNGMHMRNMKDVMASYPKQINS